MGLLNADLRERFENINFRIEQAAKRSGRTREQIKLVGVTKNNDIETIRQAYELGLREFGENRVQEFLTKYDAFTDVNWHLIGRLQTNKVKYIIDKVSLIHSVDSINLAREIDRHAAASGIVANILVQVNISGENTKAGIKPDICEEFMRDISEFENIRTKGLMTIAPYGAEKEKLRAIFSDLYKLFIDIAGKEFHNIHMEYLSAGMTNDFEIAIEEGVNLVRIGTGIFGCRS